MPDVSKVDFLGTQVDIKDAAARYAVSQLADAFDSFKAAYAVYPTGDNTARQTDIANALTQYGACYLAPGDYYINATLTLPDNARLYGAGRATHVIYKSGVTGAMIRCGNGNQIANIWFDGGLSERPSTTQGTRHCILVEKEEGSSDKLALQMHDCWVTGFGGIGVLANKNGYGNLQSVQITNCMFRFNGIGVRFAEHGEYGVVSNCSFLKNYHGASIAGGNNFMSNCLLSDNYTGAYVYGTVNNVVVDNNSHGSFVGCVFNHNEYRGLEFNKITAGYTVIGGYVGKSGNSDVYINSPLVHFSGTRFLSVLSGSKTFTFGTGAGLSLSGCVFNGSPIYALNGTGRIHFNGCYRAPVISEEVDGQTVARLSGELVPYKYNKYYSGDDIPVTEGTTLDTYRPTGAVITDTNKWSNTGASGYQCLFLRIDPGSGVKITTKAGVTSYYGVMKSWAEPADGSNAPLSTKTGYTGVFTKTGQETVTFTAPDDAKYLYICTKYNGTDVSPDALVIDGIDLMTGYDLTRHGFIPAAE